MTAAHTDAVMMGPGRQCPAHYRYRPADLRTSPPIDADILYVVGGLYGNPEALRAVLALKRAEESRGRSVTLLFNGDFNWFNVDPEGFRQVNERVLEHRAIQGNVEAELARSSVSAGCGCAYPATVADRLVERSNRIMACLQTVAAGAPDLTAQMSGLAMYAVARVGGVRVGIVHGDAESLAGWRFDAACLRRGTQGVAGDRIADHFRAAGVDVFCSSHTCLPAMQVCQVDGRRSVIANNGAAGMPNFSGARHGLLTRVAASGRVPENSLYGVTAGGGRIDAIPIPYDHAAWLRRFTGNWPLGSAAHQSYFRRMTDGPRHTLAQAMLDGVLRCDGDDAATGSSVHM